MKDLKVNDFVVLHHIPHATVWRVVEIDGDRAGLRDVSIEHIYPDQVTQYTDISLLKRPTREQLLKL